MHTVGTQFLSSFPDLILLLLLKNEVSIALLLSFCSFVEGLAELVVQNSEDIVRLFEQGNRVRKMASVDKNSGGSRYCC